MNEDHRKAVEISRNVEKQIWDAAAKGSLHEETRRMNRLTRGRGAILFAVDAFFAGKIWEPKKKQ